MKTCVAMVCLTALALAWLARDQFLDIRITHKLDLGTIVRKK